jgi:hypothetical protein
LFLHIFQARRGLKFTNLCSCFLCCSQGRCPCTVLAMASDALSAKALASQRETSTKEQLRPPLFPLCFSHPLLPLKSLVADTHLELFWKINFLICTHSLTWYLRFIAAFLTCASFCLYSSRNSLNWTPNKQRSSKSERLNSWYVSQNRLPHFEAYLWAYLVLFATVGTLT